ncbi:uncharacterized protein [Diadema setosum]|uniref:uncharacterized protein n=1 Tax=Diadema setosum TaxID=31175 RepID=UPI003B3B385A
MDTAQLQNSATQITYIPVQANSSPILGGVTSHSPIQKLNAAIPVVTGTTLTFNPASVGHGVPTNPIHLSSDLIQQAGVFITTQGNIQTDATAPTIQLASESVTPANVVMVTTRDAGTTTPIQQISERGNPSSLVMATRRDADLNESHQEESRLNMSQYSSVLNSFSDQDQASMDLEVQAVMFPESRGLLPTVKRICPSRSSSSSKASSKSSYSPMRQSTTFTNTKRGNTQTTTPPFTLVEQNIHQLSAQGEQTLIADKLEAGVDIDEADSQGHTPLMWACQHHQTDTVRFLLENGADPRKTSTDGETALAFACSIGNLEMVHVLLSKKASVDVYDYNGGTPLIYAVYHNHPAVVQLLLDSGADMTVEMESGHTPLSLAMALGHKQVQRVIEQHMLSLFQVS